MKMTDSKKYRLYGLLGLVGGILFMIGDCLLFVYPNRNTDLDVDPVFAEMPLFRFNASALLGVIGMGFMLLGFQSLYAMAKAAGGPKLRALALLGGVGAAGTALAHFNLGTLLPLAHKGILASGGSPQLAESACKLIAQWVTPIDILLIILLYVQFIVLSYMIISGKAKMPRIYILLGPIGAIALGVLWKAIFSGSTIAGAWGACESLGEGLMYLTAAIYWKKNLSEAP